MSNQIKKIITPPISEAIIDIRVKKPRDIDKNKFDILTSEVKNDYPIIEPRSLNELKIITNKPKHQFRSEFDGYLCKSQDEKEIVQFRRDGFTLNRLSPYTNWETLIDSVHKLWEKYYQIIKPLEIHRIAVRYINHIKIPKVVGDFSEYLSAPPQIPSDLHNRNLMNFFSRCVVNNPIDKIQTNIIQSIEETIEDGITLVILDIDSYHELTGQYSEESLWNTFQKLRNEKNTIFIKSITNKTLELFK